MANIDYTAVMASDIAGKLYSEAYADLDEAILASMAAGVPASNIYIEHPKAQWDGTKVSLVSKIGYR